MKRTPIIVTPENIKAVKGMLEKFFYNKNKNGFNEWHNFDIGFKKRFKPYAIKSCLDENEIIVCKNKYIAPQEIVIREPNENYPYHNIAIIFTDSEIQLISVGDKIMFMNNRFVHCEKWYNPDNHDYIYTTYQMTRLREHEKRKIAQDRDFENSYVECDYDF